MQVRFALLVFALAVSACSLPPGQAGKGAAAPSATGQVVGPGLVAAASESESDRGAKLPIHPDDARWGSPAAPVTIVAFVDLQCPFCRRAEATITELERRYGPSKLRVVYKHNPLPFHRMAEPAALIAIRARAAGGDAAFFRFVEALYASSEELSPEVLERLGRDAGIPAGTPAPPGTEQHLARDIALATEVEATGTPSFFVNGVRITGAQPYDAFAAVIDAELAAIDAAAREGKAASYADRVAANYAPPAPRPPEPDEEEDTKRWRVPVGKSPVLGPADALVTLVEFSEYQCPFCSRVQPTLAKLRELYGNDLRIVWKHNPLPFHPRARPAAELAAEVYRVRGNDAFWSATEKLFAAQSAGLDDAALLAIAAEVGLDAKKAALAIARTTYVPAVQEDIELAVDFAARGTPHFFVNGHRISGAQPLENFVALIDVELAAAKKLVLAGIPQKKLYDQLLATAEGPPGPPVVDVGVVPGDRPSRGPKNAPIVVYEFEDYQCPFCKRVQPTVEALRKEFPRDVRVVSLNLPLAFHSRARAAANAAAEVRAHAGDAAFWKMHELLFENQADLSDDVLKDLARRAGGDPEKTLAAVAAQRHDALIDADAEIASRAGIRGTPGFVVGRYFVSGAQPIEAFRSVVKRALDDRRKPAPAAK